MRKSKPVDELTIEDLKEHPIWNGQWMKKKMKNKTRRG